MDFNTTDIVMIVWVVSKYQNFVGTKDKSNTKSEHFLTHPPGGWLRKCEAFIVVQPVLSLHVFVPDIYVVNSEFQLKHFVLLRVLVTFRVLYIIVTVLAWSSI